MRTKEKDYLAGALSVQKLHAQTAIMGMINIMEKLKWSDNDIKLMKQTLINIKVIGNELFEHYNPIIKKENINKICTSCKYRNLTDRCSGCENSYMNNTMFPDLFIDLTIPE